MRSSPPQLPLEALSSSSVSSMSLKKMIRKMMNELGEAVEEVNFAQLKLKKAENNAESL